MVCCTNLISAEGVGLTIYELGALGVFTFGLKVGVRVRGRVWIRVRGLVGSSSLP